MTELIAPGPTSLTADEMMVIDGGRYAYGDDRSIEDYLESLYERVRLSPPDINPNVLDDIWNHIQAALRTLNQL